ncbi:MAG: hypothetical protein IPK82_14635 [Polyangiaceae bacterium]|nr:hypothetical protein [Polyangiaceae bacterium]
MTFEEQFKLVSVLAVLATEGRQLEGRLRVQKVMYLLQQKGVQELAPVFFEYHHYGPFSTEVVDMLNDGVRSNVVTEEHQRDGDWKKYVYSPSDKASRYAEKLQEPSRKIIGEVWRACSDLHWRTLELAATADYLRRADEISLEDAFRAALQRKPACREYETDARKLLETLNLT